MSIICERYHKKSDALWDTFVSESANGTIFQTRRFLSYHGTHRFRDYSWIFRKNERIVGLFPAAVLEKDSRTRVISHPGASYGGIVYKNEMGVREANDMVQCILRRLKDDGIHDIRITLTPAWYDVQPNDYIEFALIKAGFTYEKQELSSVVPVSSLPEDVTGAFGEATRRAIRKAKKNSVVIEWSDDLESYYPILERNLSLRHNVSPTHTLDELEKIRQLFPEKIRLLRAVHHKSVIGGIVVFICNARTAVAFYISHDMDYQHLRAVDYLMANLLQWGRDNGFLYIDFGTFTLNMEPNWGLGKFKEKFSAKGAFRSTLSLSLV